MEYINPINISSVESTQFDDIELSDIVITYNNGVKWKVIKLSAVLNYCILYDKQMTIVVDPITLCSCVLDGKYTFKKYINSEMFLEKDNEEISIYQYLENRHTIYISTIGSIILMFPDIEYIDLQIKSPKNIDKLFEYYKNKLSFDNNTIKNNDIHPKSIVYIHMYKNKKGIVKKKILYNKDEKDKITGYDLKESNFIDNLINKKTHVGFVFPILYYCFATII